MFDFFNDIFLKTNSVGGFKFVCNAGNEIYFQGIKDVLIFENEQIVLKLNNKEITVLGKNLSLKEIDSGSILIGGKILDIQLFGDDDEKL